MKRWKLSKFDFSLVEEISNKYSLPKFLATLFAARNFVCDIESIEQVLCRNRTFSSPFSIKDMDKACRRLHRAIEHHEKVYIYGDYDADGTTGVSILYLYLKEYGVDVSYYIPERDNEGYGINTLALDKFAEDGTSLLIAVDNGISCFAETIYAKRLGIDVIIIDHHRQHGNSVPEACAVVDPHRLDCKSSFKEYCASGLVLKFISAMETESGNVKKFIDKYSALAAIGTIGDSVPVLGENRKIIKLGLEKINSDKNSILYSALQFFFQNKTKFSIQDISFNLVPRINATGRVSYAKKAVEFLTCQDRVQVQNLAKEIDADNRLRKTIQESIIQEVRKIAQENPCLLSDRVIVLDGVNWHKGVLGIVAARVVELYDKPCIILSKDGEEAVASGRSIAGFSLYEAIYHCKEYFTKFGGHHMAVGLSMKSDNIPAFRKAINQYAKENHPQMPYNELNIDCKLSLDKLSPHLLEELESIEPFGNGFEEPVILLEKLQIKRIIKLKSGKYLKLVVNDGYYESEVLCFSYSSDNFPYNVSDTVDLAVSISKNDFNSTISLSIVLKDIRLHDVDYNIALEEQRLYEAFVRGENIIINSEMLPSRDDFIKVYKFIKTNRIICSNIKLIYENFNAKINYFKICAIIDVLIETNLVEESIDAGQRILKIINTNDKVNLFESETFLKLRSFVSID